MNVSIIIINYNTEDLTLNCINSIIKKTKDISFEIIIVDNASPNKPIKLKKRDDIKFIQSDINLGFGKANNLGAKYAQGDYLFMLNPDTILTNNAIYILWEYIKQHPKVGTVGSNLYSKDLTPNCSYGIKDPSIWEEFIASKNFLAKRFIENFNHSSLPKKVAYISGASLMISKQLFYQINGFDKDFFMYYEDTFLGYIVRKNGYVNVNIPQAKIIHLDGQSFNLKKIREYYSFEGRKLYLIKRYNKIYYLISNIILLINSIFNALFLYVSGKDNLAKIWTYRIKLILRIA